MKKAVLVLLLVGVPVFATPIALRISEDFNLSEGKQKTHQTWRNTLIVEPGKTYVVNDAKKHECEDKECKTEEFITQITPQWVQADVLKIDFVFSQGLEDRKNRIEGSLISRVNEHSEFELKSDKKRHLHYTLKARPYYLERRKGVPDQRKK